MRTNSYRVWRSGERPAARLAGPHRPRFCRGAGADIGHVRRIWYFVRIFNQIDLRSQRLNDSPRRNAVTPSARAAALRSTAIHGFGDRPGAGRRACRHWRPTPGPSQRFHCRSRGRSRATSVPKTKPSPPPRPRPTREVAPNDRGQDDAPAARRHRARDAPACGLAAAAARKPRGAGGGGRDLVDLAGRHRRAGKRHRTRAQAQAGRCDPGRSGDIGSGRAESSRNGSSCAATTMARRSSAIAPSSRPIRAGRRRPSCAGALEAALWDDHRDDATVWSWFENESPLSAKGKFALARAHDRARRPRQCRAPGARRLAQRFDVGGHREHRARPVRRAADAGRPKGADGSAALRQRARGRAARRQAARRRRGRAGQGAHRGLPQGLQHQGAARGGAARTARRSPATSSARSSCCAAKRNSPRPPS